MPDGTDGGHDREPREGYSQQAELDAPRQREARYRFLLENTSEIITVLDADGAIVWQSPSLEPILGVEPRTLIGTSMYVWVHPEDAARIQNALVDCLTDPTSRPTGEFRCQHADGSWRRFEGIWANRLDEQSVGGVVLNARDVTEGTEYEDQLARQVFYDPLTGLPNRVLFTYFVEHAPPGAALAAGAAGRWTRLDERQSFSARAPAARPGRRDQVGPRSGRPGAGWA